MKVDRGDMRRLPALYARFSSDLQNPSSETDQFARYARPTRGRPKTGAQSVCAGGAR
jgi:hypothetical protein